jgi:hypothetical protein
MLFDLYEEGISMSIVVRDVGGGVRSLRDDDLSSAEAMTRASLEDKLK